MVGEVPMVGTAKAKAIATEIALRAERKKARNKKLLEAATRKELQESHLTEERNKKNARERGTICSFLSCSRNVNNAKELQFQRVDSGVIAARQ